MADSGELDLAALRSLVRGELPREERRRLNRALGRCVDSKLPDLLYNLQVEWEQEQADSKLPVSWRRVSEFFVELWQQGHGGVDETPIEVGQKARVEEHAVLFSGAGGRHAMNDALALAPQEDEIGLLDIFLYPALTRRRVILLVTTDAHAMYPATDTLLSVSTQPEPIGWCFDEDDGGRITFWMITADDPTTLDPVPEGVDALRAWLQRLRGEPGCGLKAQRLTHHYLRARASD